MRRVIKTRKNGCVAANYFNWTMTPLFSSDVLFKYGGFWLTAKEAELKGMVDNGYRFRVEGEELKGTVG